jgi:hypothetical protein
MARQAAVALAEAEMESVLPFLLASRSAVELAHRAGLAEDSISSIAARTGLDTSELMETVRRRYALMREALVEGENPLAWIPDGGGNGSGPEKPDEHDEGSDYSHGYSEVPAGPEGGPDPQVTQVRPPNLYPVEETKTGARRTAAGDDMMTPGFGQGGGPSMPAGVGSGAGAMPADTTPAADEATSGGLEDFDGTGSASGTSASIHDPVRRRVMQVSAAIRRSNPFLPEQECARVARVVVGRYLRRGDLNSSVMGDGSVDDPPQGGGGGGGEGGGGMSGMGEAMVGRQLVKSAPELLEALM